MKITTAGVDLAKNLMQVHCVDERGRAVIRKQLRRDQLLRFFGNLSPCWIGMEACSGAHHWARELEKLGHTVKLMAPQFVKPYVKTNKNDGADAEAICEAIPQGICHIPKRLPEILEDGANNLPGVFRQLLHRLGEHLKALDRQVSELELQIQLWHRQHDASRKLAQSPGSTQAGANRSCWGLVSVATPIYARCSFTAPEQ